jgi:flagellar assembly protein FliH
MSTRLDIAGATVLPFSFPSLGDEPAQAADEAAAGELFLDETALEEDGGVSAEPEASGDAALFDAIAALPGDAGEMTEADPAAALDGAREEAARQGFSSGHEEGYAAGFAEGAAAAQARLAEEAGRIAAIADRLAVPIAALEQPVEEAVAALALEVARCVIGDEVKRSREFLVKLVREAIAKVPLAMGAPRVLLNPADLELVRKLAPEINEGNAALLVADETIEPGGALVVADGEERQIKDRRWNPRSTDGVSQVNLTLSSRWRAVMLTLFDGEDEG